MSGIASIEFDGKYTVTYRMADGRESAFRVLPEVGRLIGASRDLHEALNALITGSGPTEGGGSAPCWCSKPWKELNAHHSRACQLARAAIEKATVRA